MAVMKDDRELVFSRITQALAPLKEAGKQSPYPEWEVGLAVCRAHPEFASRWELFAHKMAQVNGTPLRGLTALGEWLKGRGHTLGYCDPAWAERCAQEPAFAGIQLETTFDRKRLDDYAFGITRAAGAVAETGTVMLKDAQTSSRLGALAPWVHVALLEEGDIYADVPSAIAGLGDDPAVVWATGPSKTADVEGILIEGVHGPGVQICCLL